MVRGQFSQDEKQQTANSQDTQNQNKVGSEPIFFLAFIEQDLKRADAQGEQADAPVVDAAFAALDVRRIKNEESRHHYGGDTNRNVDVEQPAPAIAVRDPAA